MNLMRYFFLTLVLVFSGESLPAQLPEFDLKIKNMRLSDTLKGKNNVLEFDIVMVHTNSIVTGPFRYFSGQYFLEFNPLVANGGELSYLRISTDLPERLKQGSASVDGNLLRLTVSMPFDPMPVINTSSGGTLIAKMRLATSADSFADVPFDLAWRNSSGGNPYTKISAYINGAAIDVTKSGSYSVENVLLPPYGN